ncbi:MAG: DUF3108 domain-containing protein [Bacteroidales bacterium]|jgi:hypothetical protein
MKRLLLIILCLQIPAIFLKGQVIPYQPGEKVSWVIRYGLVTGGVATFELKKDTFAGREVYHSIFMAKTTGLAEALYTIKDIYESYMEPNDEMPVCAIRNVQEGHYRRYNPVTFDRDTRADSAILTSNLTGKHVTQKDIRDVISFYYYFRRNWLATDYPFKKGEIITVMTWFTDELFPISMVYVGTEMVRTKAGRIKCYKFNPVTEIGRIFKTNEDVSIWFSADKNNLPVKVRFDIFVGAFTAELISYEGLVAPLEIVEK